MANKNGRKGGNGVATKRGPGRPRVRRALDEIESEGGKTATATKPGRAKKPKLAPVQIPIPAPRVNTIRVPIVGTEILVVNKMSEKARKEMLGKHMQLPKTKKEKKDPFKDFLGSLHILPEHKAKAAKLPRIDAISEDDTPTKKTSWKSTKYFGFPAQAFKKAILSSCKLLEGITRSHMAIAIHVHGESGGLVPINYSRLCNLESVVRIGPFGNRVPDIRFRGMFIGWDSELTISYDANLVSKEQIIALVENSGRIGIGEHRPEKEGSWGTFAVRRSPARKGSRN